MGDSMSRTVLHPIPQMILPSQLALLASLIIYPFLLRLFSGPTPTPPRLAKAIKGTSTLHSTLTTLLSLHLLSQPQWHSARPLLPPHSHPTTYPDDTLNPTIALRSPYANAITALECGYLLQDTFALLHLSRLQRAHRVPSTLDKTLLMHHISIGAALLLLQYYIAQQREAGIYVVVQFLLMNASTPILNLRWYLRQFATGRRGAIAVADGVFVVAFFFARVGLVGWILGDYGRWHGWSAGEAFWYGLRLPCQVGTGALVVANLGWWGVLVGNTVGRTGVFMLGGQ